MGGDAPPNMIDMNEYLRPHQRLELVAALEGLGWKAAGSDLRSSQLSTGLSNKNYRVQEALQSLALQCLCSFTRVREQLGRDRRSRAGAIPTDFHPSLAPA